MSAVSKWEIGHSKQAQAAKDCQQVACIEARLTKSTRVVTAHRLRHGSGYMEVGDAFDAKNGVSFRATHGESSWETATKTLNLGHEKGQFRCSPATWLKIEVAYRQMSRAYQNGEMGAKPIPQEDDPRYNGDMEKAEEAIGELNISCRQGRGGDKPNTRGPRTQEKMDLVDHFTLRRDPGPLLFERVGDETYDETIPHHWMNPGIEVPEETYHYTKKANIGGQMFKALMWTPSGIRMVQTDKTEWIPEESLLCVGVEPGLVECASIEDGKRIDAAIKSYEANRTASFRGSVTSRDVSAYLEEKARQEAKISKAKIAAEEREKQDLVDAGRIEGRVELVAVLKETLEVAAFDREADLRNSLLALADDFQKKAIDIHRLLAKEEAEKQLAGRILETLSRPIPFEEKGEPGDDMLKEDGGLEVPIAIPCRRNQGHGENCCEGRLCGTCKHIICLECDSRELPRPKTEEEYEVCILMRNSRADAGEGDIMTVEEVAKIWK